MAFQTSPAEKESNKRLHFTFQHQISGRNQNKNIKIGGMTRFQNRMDKIKKSSLKIQTEI